MNMQAYFTLVHLISVLALFLAIHFVLWRISKISKGVRSLIAIAVGSYMIGTIVLAEWIDNQLLGLTLWVSTPMYLFSVMGYLHFYVGIDRSVSVRILGELVKNHRGQMTMAEFAEIYPQEAMVAHRLDTLVAAGWFEYDGKYYNVTKKGKLLAKLARILQRFYKLEITG